MRLVRQEAQQRGAHLNWLTSANNPHAVGTVGEVGLMQVRPSWFQAFSWARELQARRPAILAVDGPFAWSPKPRLYILITRQFDEPTSACMDHYIDAIVGGKVDRRFSPDHKPGIASIQARLPARRLLQRKDLFERGIRFSNTHLLKMEREGKFVARLYLSPAKVAWPEDEVDAWLEARLAERKVAASS